MLFFKMEEEKKKKKASGYCDRLMQQAAPTHIAIRLVKIPYQKPLLL